MDPASEQGEPRVLPVPVGIDASGTRTETDSTGSVDVPAYHYRGAQTQRSLTYRVVVPERLTRPGEATAAGERRGGQTPRGGEEPSGGQHPGGGEPGGGTP